MKKTEFNVLSPDGFPIERDKTYSTPLEAKQAIVEWKKRYESQGYYSSVKGRIALEDLESCCRIIKDYPITNG